MFTFNILKWISYFFIKKEKPYTNLDHIFVPSSWRLLKNEAWNRASRVLSADGLKATTKCKYIIIEEGIKINPKTGQWGCPTNINGTEFWYAGLTNLNTIRVVGTPISAPYSKSQGILTHEVAESILNTNPQWANKTNDERNKYLWSIGL